MQNVEVGCVDIWLDEIVPCLKNNKTGEFKETAVFEIQSKSFLKGFREDNGWRINWYDLPQDVKVYALVLKENTDVQGLVALKKDDDVKAAYIHWACTAPHNNKHDFGSQLYGGVGGHLFAIAADMSCQWGFDGFMYGFALNKELEKHYIGVMGAVHIGILHEYQFVVLPESSKKLLEVYSYEWN